MNHKQSDNLSLQPGNVYRREDLAPYSNAIDRHLKELTHKGTLKKVGAGLYYAPKKSRFGALPPSSQALVHAFLKEDTFLLFSWNDYNALGLGLTQLYNRTVVYNYKRHGVFTLGSQEFDFRRPPRGFPKKLSKAFLVADLVNNLNGLNEDCDQVAAGIKKLPPSLLEEAKKFNNLYGKVSSKKFFQRLKT